MQNTQRWDNSKRATQTSSLNRWHWLDYNKATQAYPKHLQNSKEISKNILENSFFLSDFRYFVTSIYLVVFILQTPNITFFSEFCTRRIIVEPQSSTLPCQIFSFLINLPKYVNLQASLPKIPFKEMVCIESFCHFVSLSTVFFCFVKN